MYTSHVFNVILEVLSYTLLILCLLLTIILLWMILGLHHKELGTYRFLLLASCFTNICYEFSHALTFPIPEVYKTAFIMAGHGVWKARCSMLVWAIVYSLSFPLLIYSFLYRLIAVKYPFSIDIFTKPGVILFMVVFAVANAAIWSGITLLYWFTDDYDNAKYVREFFMESDFPTYVTHDIKELENYIVIVYWDHDLFDGLNWRNVLGSTVLGIVAGGAYDFMAFASYNIVMHIRKEQHLSERSRKLHVQLFSALVMQAVIPFFTAYLPIAFCCILPFFGSLFRIIILCLNAPFFSVITPPMCGLHPVLDCLIMLTTVSQFRKTLSNFFYCRGVRRNSKVGALEDVPSAFTTQMPPEVKLNRKLSLAYGM